MAYPQLNCVVIDNITAIGQPRVVMFPEQQSWMKIMGWVSEGTVQFKIPINGNKHSLW